MSNKKRYLIVMILGVLLNEGLHQVASAYHLPVWLDITGTAFAAIVLEPTAGLLVGLFNNFILAAFYYDTSSLIYYSVSAAVAVIVGVYLKKDGKICIKRIFPTMLFVILVTSLLTGLTTLWRNGGISDSVMERYYYTQALNAGVPHVLACFYGGGVLKVFDTIATTIIVGGLYTVLPKCLKYPPDK